MSSRSRAFWPVDAAAEEEPAAEKPPAKEEPVVEPSGDLIEVTLSPADKMAMDQKPEDTLVAADIRAKGLVPIKSVTYFMNPNSEAVISGLPENVVLVFKKMVDGMDAGSLESGRKFRLVSGELAKLVSMPNPKKAEEEESGEASGEEGAAPPAEGGAPPTEGGAAPTPAAARPMGPRRK